MSVEGIILAAGLSSRMRKFKMTLDIGGKTLLERCIDSMYEYCKRVIIVGGYRFEDIRDIADNYTKVELIYNENYTKGMISSIRHAFNHLIEDRFFFVPGDYALISRNTYGALLEEEEDILIPAYKGEKGHPILMKSLFAEHYLNDDRDITLRDFIRETGYKTVDVDDEGILLDLDTDDDYKRIIDKVKKHGKYHFR